MSGVGHAIRRATLAATRLHRDLGLQTRAIREGGRIDIFGVIAKLDVVLILKPLEGLLGAYIKDPSPGVLITTKRPLSVQRFTAAHELGHHQLNHQPSLDDESILRRTPFQSKEGDDLQEVEADAFAAAFLLPRWLVNWHCKHQGWTDTSLQNPDTIYQLALRAGTSYSATCWTLHRYRILQLGAARHLASIEPKEIKQRLLDDVQPINYYGDVWVLTLKDAGIRLEGGPSDLFVMQLPEHSGSGFLWNANFDRNIFAVMADRRTNNNPEDAVGGELTRHIVVQSCGPQSGSVELAECRPWQPSNPLTRFAVRFELAGAEAEGYSRSERRLRLEAA